MVVVAVKGLANSRVGVGRLPAKWISVAAFNEGDATIGQSPVFDRGKHVGEVVHVVPQRRVLPNVAEVLGGVMVRNVGRVRATAIVFEAFLIPSPWNRRLPRTGERRNVIFNVVVVDDGRCRG